MFSLEDLERLAKAGHGRPVPPQPPVLNPFLPPTPQQIEYVRGLETQLGLPLTPTLEEVKANPNFVLGPGERFLTPEELTQVEAANAQAQALANEMANKATMKGKHKYGFFGPSSNSHGTPRTETMLEQGARHHPIVGGVVSNIIVPCYRDGCCGPCRGN